MTLTADVTNPTASISSIAMNYQATTTTSTTTPTTSTAILATATNADPSVAVSDTNATTRSALGTAIASQSHLYAQRLNNSAALCIEIGHYGRAISSLQKALELNRNHSKEWKDRNNNEEVCKCYNCTLDACITFSEKTASKATVVADINSFVAVPTGSTNDKKINDARANTSANASTIDNSNNKRRKVCTSPSMKIDSTFWKPPSHTKQQQQRLQSISKDQQDNSDNDSNKENTLQHVNFQKGIPSPSSIEQQKQRQSETQEDYHEEEHEDDDDDNCSGGYIYRRPIRVSCEGHAMGSTLYLIITFNLALAHHLHTISSCDVDIQRRSKLVNRTLVIYELTYKWHLKLLKFRSGRQASSATSNTSSPSSISLPSPSPSSSTPMCTAVTSIRFNMIIRNNLSQIHRFVGNHTKHTKCLEHLLSTVMVVAEYKSRMPMMTRVMSHRTKDPRCMELDGFLQNTTAIVLQKGHCAKAA